MKSKTIQYKCDECGLITVESKMLNAPHPFDALEYVSSCPQCLSIGPFLQVCDEPECREVVFSYRDKCAKHYAEDL